jgi:hypothetical protein
MHFILLVMLFHFSFAWTNLSQGSSNPRVARWSRGEREGPYPRGGVGYLWLAVFSAWPPTPCLNSLKAKVETYLACLRIFAIKWDHFLGGAPAVGPEGDLVFWESQVAL